MPRYTTFHTPVVATAKKGSTPGELFCQSAVAIHEDTHQILVANYLNQRVEKYSLRRESSSISHSFSMGVGQLSRPWGIATHGDSVYVSCRWLRVSAMNTRPMGSVVS